jgi:magnesium transporter
MPSDELTDLFECVSDEDLKKYLKLIQRKQRNKIISLLTLDPESAGRIMNSDVLTLQRDFTVKKSISLLQRIDLPKETLRKIYVTNKDNILVGHINLEDLVLNKPETPLTRIIHKNELIIDVHEDQEEVAKQMHHYGLLSAPVVGENNYFLGVITADDIVDIVEEEASEDVYKMSGLGPVEHSYFQTSFSNLFFHRSIWLGSLLLFQSVSVFILGKYQALTQSHLFLSFFYTMLIGAGGNAGNQSATLVIRGLATGEISRKNAIRVLFREFWMSIALALVLFVITFARVYFLHHNLIGSIAISISLFLIINMSMILGTFIPFFLERLNLDPAHSAAPFLATLMDILGLLIYCLVCSKILG